MKFDADRLLIAGMRAIIDASYVRSSVQPTQRWNPSRPLELLLVGYNGARNTGADVRVSEMVRQLHHLLGYGSVSLSVTTLNEERTRGYFPGARQRLVSKARFPVELARMVQESDGVLACEGSMFKSKFASALSVLMAGGLGLALSERKLAIGYGGEAGAMSPELESFVRRTCADALVLARTEPSANIARQLGMRTELGTDTAWTCDVSPHDGGRLLRSLGLSPDRPLLGVCPINPYWWPVRPDVVRASFEALRGARSPEHHSSVYFHRGGADVESNLNRYIRHLARAVDSCSRRRDAQVIIIGMEALDRRACDMLAREISEPATLMVSDEYRWPEMVQALRTCRWLVTSRYHAAVCSMPALVPSVGVTMDERLTNLMGERGTPELCHQVDSADLVGEIERSLDLIDDRRDAIESQLRDHVRRCLQRMDDMGGALVREVRRIYPEFPLRDGLGEPDVTDLRHLPPLGELQRNLLDISS